MIFDIHYPEETYSHIIQRIWNIINNIHQFIYNTLFKNILFNNPPVLTSYSRLLSEFLVHNLGFSHWREAMNLHIKPWGQKSDISCISCAIFQRCRVPTWMMAFLKVCVKAALKHYWAASQSNLDPSTPQLHIVPLTGVIMNTLKIRLREPSKCDCGVLVGCLMHHYLYIGAAHWFWASPPR